MPTRTKLVVAAAAALTITSGSAVALAMPSAASTAPQHLAAAPSSTPDDSEDQGIVGGWGSQGHPAMSALSIIHDNGDEYTCGGTQISADLVLTAAHCFDRGPDGSRPTRVSVRIGSTRRNSGGTVRTATQWRLGGGPERGDWAVLKLSQPYASGRYAFLAAGSGLDREPMFLAMGWGATSEGGNPSGTLLEVEVPLVPDSHPACGGGSAEICAGDVNRGGIDTCQGDSGGPLWAYDGDALTQVGIVSWGNGCARRGEAGHYAQVSTYRNSILSAGRALGGQLPR